MNTNTFTLLSSDLGGSFSIAQLHEEAGGENISPQLYWVNFPKNTASFAVTIYDQSAPTGGGFWHWVMFDIPAQITSLPTGCGKVEKNLLPAIVTQSINDYGTYGYGGPNPPKGHGFHLYLITVYALDIPHLGLTKDTMPNLVGFNLWEHTINKASIVSYYKVD